MLVGISSEIERIKEEIAKRKSGLEFFKLYIDIPLPQWKFIFWDITFLLLLNWRFNKMIKPVKLGPCPAIIYYLVKPNPHLKYRW